MKMTKTLLCSLFVFTLSMAFGQGTNSLTPEEYDSLKANNQLHTAGNYQIQADSALWNSVKKKKHGGIPQKATGCISYTAPDNSYQLALAPNDDGSSSPITIPFDFCFYGDTMNTMWINNNGNISFQGPYATFSPSAFPSMGNELISPFWADIDTRNNLGEVWYKVTPTAIYVNWVDCGYYNMHGDKRNTFQLVITDGVDPIIQGGNVAFLYDDMQLTTGDASNGVNGFGGIPGTAGMNKGDNVAFFLLGQFDHPGTDYDGAGGNTDGVSWLDDQNLFFDVCSTDNIAPVPNGLTPCDTFRICSVQDTADFPIIFLSPEPAQTTTISVDFGGLTTASVVSNNPGNTAEVIIRAWGDASSVGLYNITVTATDDFSPTPGVTSFVFTIEIDSTGAANFNPVIDPTEGCDSVELTVLNGPYDSYLWLNSSQDPTVKLYDSQANYSVTVEKNGCFRRVVEDIFVGHPLPVNIQGDFLLCEGATQSFMELPDSNSFGTVSWGLADPGLDSAYSNLLDTGTYTVTIEDSLGLCISDTTFSISNHPAQSLRPFDSICGNQYAFNYDVGGSEEGYWTFYPATPVPSFQDFEDAQTNVDFTDNGIYNLVYTDTVCMTSDTSTISVASPFSVQLTGNTFYCPADSGTNITIIDSNKYSSITWGNDPVYDGIFSNDLVFGNYTITLTDTFGVCEATQNLLIESQEPLELIDDLVYCDSMLIMTGNTGGSGQGFWTVESGPGVVTFESISLLNQTVTFSDTGTYVLVYTDNMCNDTDTLQITYVFGAGYDINDFDLLVCFGETIFVEFPDSSDLVSINWFTGIPEVDSSYARTLGPGIHSYRVIDTIGCAYDSTFIVSEQQETVLIDQGDQCGDTIQLFGNSGVEPGQWSKVSGPGTVEFLGDSINPKVKFSEWGFYELAYDSDKCPAPDTLNVNVQFYPYIEVATHFGCSGKEVEFKVFDAHENVDQFEWSNGEEGPTATFTELGQYDVVATNTCGTHTAYFAFDGLNCDLEMPNVFTPNADGVNSLFTVRIGDPTAFSNVNIKIFNRWGHLLYESNDLSKGWDGVDRASGKEVLEGTYFYTVSAFNLDGERVERQGYFHLIRQE